MKRVPNGKCWRHSTGAARTRVPQWHGSLFLVDATHCWSSASARLTPSSRLIRQLHTDAKLGAEPGFVLLVYMAKESRRGIYRSPYRSRNYEQLNSSQTKKCHEISSDTAGSDCACRFRSSGQNIVKIPGTAVTRLCSW